MVQDKRHRLCEWIEIKKRGSPNVSLHMVGVKVVQKRNKTVSHDVKNAFVNIHGKVAKMLQVSLE